MRRLAPRVQSWCEADGARCTVLVALGLTGLCLVAFFNQLGTLGLMDKTEGLFVEVARAMLASGDWVTPRWNGELFFDYPVWGYWMVALSFRLFGISEWAARLPSALAATATVLALFALVLRLAPAQEPLGTRLARAGLVGLLMVFNPAWVVWGRSAVTDMYLASAITLALASFLLAWQAPATAPRQRRLGHVGLALFCGVAVLAKGPVGLLLPGLVIGLFLLLKRQLLPELRRTPLLPMLALFLGVVLPWYASATQANGMAFLSHFLGFSNLERFTSVLYAHPGPPWFYLPRLLLLLFPWSLYLPVACARQQFLRWSRWRGPAGPDDLPLFALVWLGLILAFFSAAATKLPGYILPALPAALVLVGLLFRPFPTTLDPPGAPTAAPTPLIPWGAVVTGWLNAVLLALLAALAAMAPRLVAGDPSYPDFAAALGRSGIPVGLAFLLAAAALGLGVLLLQSPPRWRQLWQPNGALFLAVLALVVTPLAPLLDRERQLPIRQLAAEAARLGRPGEPLLVVGYMRYSVVYYSGRKVLFVSSPTKARRVLAHHHRSSSLMVFGNDAELLEFGIGPGDSDLLARRQAHRLVRLPASWLQRGRFRP